MNERIKELRNALGLSGEKFGAAIGLKKSAISQIESGKANLTEQSILSICREFNVNEEWLRTGSGDMFSALSQLSLDDLMADADPIDIEIMKAYFTLDKDIRRKAIEHFKKSLCD
ncbi:MAG: helix-turn-helix transcriptional regulator [Clostridiales bacterium]|nr:helix-turn-helix transcriptional regulator [Clostridiales bacterium]